MKLLWRVIKRAGKYKWNYVVAVAATFICSVINLLVPSLISQMTSTVAAGVNEESLKIIGELAAWIATAYVVRVGFEFVSDYWAHVAAWNLVANMRIEMYDHIQRLSLEFFHKNQTGDLLSRVIGDTTTLEQLYAHIIPDLLTNIVTALGVFVILLVTNWKLALLTCLPIPFIVAVSFIFTKKIRPNFKKARMLNGEVSAKLQDSFSGVVEVQSFGREEYEYQSVSGAVNKHLKEHLAALKGGAIFHPGVGFFSSMGSVIVVGVGGILAFKNELDVGEIVAFLLYLNLFYQPISKLARMLEEGQTSYAGAERIMAIMDTQSEIKEPQNPIPLKNVNGDIAFENVEFSYMEGTKILDGISFKFEAGKTYALVGATGVGKTTITKLLPRFYDVTAGRITIDGIDVRDVSLKDLRASIAPVMQDTFLFNATIMENIRYAMPSASDEEVFAAARAANIHDDILAMENGYDTKVGERGVRLSGGQKQRIAIARAVLRSSPIIILDEATASVDNHTEKKIQQALDGLVGKHTIIAVAHRLTTIQNSDKILVIKDGKIAECGNHEELLALGGIYADLANGNLATREPEEDVRHDTMQPPMREPFFMGRRERGGY